MIKIKFLICIMFAVFIAASNSFSQDADDVVTAESRSTEEIKGAQTDQGILYGKEITTYENVMKVNDLAGASDKYNGNLIVVRGEITDVCQSMGCWLVLSSGAGNIRVKTNHEFFVPGDIVGKIAVIEGVFKVAELTEDEANHYNEESLNKTEEIKSPVLALEIEATGIVVLNDEIMESKPVE